MYTNATSLVPWITCAAAYQVRAGTKKPWPPCLCAWTARLHLDKAVTCHQSGAATAAKH